MWELKSLFFQVMGCIGFQIFVNIVVKRYAMILDNIVAKSYQMIFGNQIIKWCDITSQ